MATRWGICSAGKISHDFTVASKTLPAEDHQVVAVAARKLEDAQEFARKHSISQAYGSYEESARNPDVDVVYVGNIHPYHLKACSLFMNAKKNVSCEKPSAMNTKEVKEISDSAKKNGVFLMEAVWTRFFPVSVEVRKSSAQGEIGEVKMVRSEFAIPLLHRPRLVEKELGGGALPSLGMYCLQFVCMVYNGERPERIQAVGVCSETGVDETVVVTLKFSDKKMAVFTYSSSMRLPNDAIIVGTKGTIQIPSWMWCPTSLIVNGKETKYPLPEPCLPSNFHNGTGMRYEAEEVRQCLLKGSKESPVVSHSDSLSSIESEDEIRRQVVAVAARKLEDAQEFARKHSISQAYGSYEESARDPDVDVVYVGNIHPYHLKACSLFMNAKKNVSCEKPSAMNAKEVKEISDSAKKNDVFLMEAVWTRFLPASVEVRKSSAQGEIGEVKIVRSEFGVPSLHNPRLVKKELGGASLSIGMYCSQIVCMVYNGERPESIQATGVCSETGVDETVIVTSKFSGKRMAVFTYSSSIQLPNEALIVGTKGTIQIPARMWCPTSLIVNGTETQYPLPEPGFPLNFHNTTGMRYEAEEVRKCLLKGSKESSIMSHSDSLSSAESEDEIRRQVGVVFSQDCQ